MLQRIVIGKRLGSISQGRQRLFYVGDECLKHSDYTRVSLSFSYCFGIIYIVLVVRFLI